MTESSILESRAHDLTAALQDYARDLEARLGVINRNRFVNPNEYASMTFAPPTVHLPTAELTVANAHWAENVLDRYHRGAGSATAAIEGHDTEQNPLSPSERAAFKAVHDLIAAIQSVQSYDEASALVATFSN